MAEQGFNEWCAGLPLVERRPMEEEERRELGHRAVALRWRGAAAILLFPGAPMLFAVVGSAAWPSAVQDVLAVAAVFVIAICLPVAILVARDAFRRSRGLARDLAVGVVERYEGPLEHRLIALPPLALLVKAGLVEPGAEGEIDLDVLPVSRRVLMAGGRPVTRWIVAPATSVAETPQFASMAAEWLQPAGPAGGQEMLRGERDLAESERSEIRAYAKRLWVRALPLAVLLTVWCGVGLLARFAGARPMSGPDTLRVGLLTFLALSADMRLAWAIQTAAQMRRDAANGRLVILRPRDGFEMPGEDAGLQATVEVLPFSRRPWTQDGRPMPWRVVRP